MTDPAERRLMLVNLAEQPLELHRADGVLVIPPGGHEPLREADRALPQLRVLLARRRVAIRDDPAGEAPPPADTTPATAPAAGRRRSREGTGAASRDPAAPADPSSSKTEA